MSRARKLGETLVFIGSYTKKIPWASGLGKGISVYSFDSNNGSMDHIHTIPESNCGINPSSLTVNPITNHIYCCNEYHYNSSITSVAFKYDPNNIRSSFEHIHDSTVTQKCNGNDPCFIYPDFQSNRLFVSTFGEHGNPAFGVYGINSENNSVEPPLIEKVCDKEDGSKVTLPIQEYSHFHYIVPTRGNTNEFYVCNTGGDKIFHYGVDVDAMDFELKSKVETAGGDGPRHIAFHPNTECSTIYVSNQLGSSINVVDFDLRDNTLREVKQRVPSLKGNEHNLVSHIVTDKSGKYLYCANRGPDNIVGFEIDEMGLIVEESGKWFDCNGKEPRHFEIDPTNNFLLVANQEGDDPNVSVFKIDHEKGGCLDLVDSVKIPNASFVHFVEM